MVGLIDIAAIEQGEVTVKVRGKDLSIRGLSSRDIKHLLRKFPALDKAMSGEGGVSGQNIVDAVPEAMEEVALMGTFHENDEARNKAREAFQSFKLHEQLAVLNAIMDNTFGDFWNPLLEKVKGLITKSFEDVAPPAAKDPGTVPRSELLKQLKNSLRSSTTMEDLFGTSAPGNSPDMPS